MKGWLLLTTLSLAMPLFAMTTLTIPDRESPVVVFRMQFRAGSAFDPSGKEGLANLTAHAILDGGTRRLTYAELQEKLYPLAPKLEVIVDKELVTFVAEVHREVLKPFYRLLKEMLLTPAFDKSDVERLKSQMVSAFTIDLLSADDETLGKQILESLIYYDHPYHTPTLGLPASIKALTPEDLKDFYTTHYTQENLTIGLAGAYPSGFEQKIRRDFMKLPNAKAPALTLPTPKLPSGRVFAIAQKNTMATAISMGFPLPITRKDKDFIPLMVATSYLGEHRTFNGILMIHMREIRGLNYGDYAYAEYFRQEGGSTFPYPNIARSQQYFSIWIRPVAHENALFSVRQAIREVDTLIQEGIPKEGFEATRKFLSHYADLWVQSLSRRLGYLMDSRFYGKVDFVKEVKRRLKTLTKQEVDEAIRKYLSTDHLYVVLVAPKGELLQSLITQDVATPIHYRNPEGTPCEVLKEDKAIEHYPLKAKKVFVKEPLKYLEKGRTD